MQDFVRRFKAKATKARQAQSRVKALERMEVIAPAHVDSPFHFTIETVPTVAIHSVKIIRLSPDGMRSTAYLPSRAAN